MERVQYNVHTSIFRQNGQFATARARLAETMPGKTLKVLSFGCSIGEEIVSLRYMFPYADVFGCDIDDGVLNTAQASVSSLATIFKSSEEAIRSHGPFDLIIASAVLCLNPVTENFKSKFPVEKFEHMIGLLDANLSENGILVITNSNYRFTESPLTKKYRTIRSDIVSSSGFIPVFDRSSNPYLDRVNINGENMYKKVGAYSPTDDEDLADSVFEKQRDGASFEPHMMSLSPVPDGVVFLRKHVRSNLDFFSKKAPNTIIEMRSEYQFGRTPDGRHGYALTVSWPSFSRDGWHVRPATWSYAP